MCDEKEQSRSEIQRRLIQGDKEPAQALLDSPDDDMLPRFRIRRIPKRQVEEKYGLPEGYLDDT